MTKLCQIKHNYFMLTIKTIMSTTPSVIKVNVGGQLFQTTSSTLHGSEFFARLLDGAIPTLKDENGAYFIDRDPKYFEVILSYLRTYKWDIPPSMDKDILSQETEFYMVKTDLGPSPSPKLKDPVGLYIGTDARLFIKKNICIVSCGTDVQWITPNAQNIYLDNGKRTYHYNSIFTSGIFVNNNTQFIMTYQTNFGQEIKNGTMFLGICPPKRPAFVRIKYPLDGCTLIARHVNVIIFNDDGTLIECNYNVEPETNLLFILHEGYPFVIKAYFFDARVAVVNINGSWKFVNAKGKPRTKKTEQRAASAEEQAPPKYAISYSYSYDYDKY